jgi:hypothetical protein
MDRKKIMDKIIRVIENCKTEDQFNTAKKYITLAYNNYGIDVYDCGYFHGTVTGLTIRLKEKS